jgi:hypothetical protein
MKSGSGQSLWCLWWWVSSGGLFTRSVQRVRETIRLRSKHCEDFQIRKEGNKMDSPWIGGIIFLVLVVGSCWWAWWAFKKGKNDEKDE